VTPSRAPVWIKVCGLRSVDAIAAAAEAGVQAVGFVFFDASPRNLTPEAAGVLAASVPRGIAKVAVFLHPTQALFDAAIEAVAPDYVQADATDLDMLAVPAIVGRLAVHRREPESEDLQRHGRRFLFESTRSGSGERADWTVAAQLARRNELILAGGLDASNVGEALRSVRPFGVDVSSGVESARGTKDVRKIHEFVSAVRAAESRSDALSAGDGVR
jgi:phosphoribosylanthranilate isomerase